MEELFRGRINRRNYVIGLVSSLAIILLTFIIVSSLGNISGLLGFVWIVVFLVSIVFNISLQVRRWHDLNKSGYFVLISFVPSLGLLVLLFLSAKGGDKKENQYGSVPKMKISFPKDILGRS